MRVFSSSVFFEPGEAAFEGLRSYAILSDKYVGTKPEFPVLVIFLLQIIVITDENEVMNGHSPLSSKATIYLYVYI